MQSPASPGDDERRSPVYFERNFELLQRKTASCLQPGADADDSSAENASAQGSGEDYALTNSNPFFDVGAFVQNIIESVVSACSTVIEADDFKSSAADVACQPTDVAAPAAAAATVDQRHTDGDDKHRKYADDLLDSLPTADEVDEVAAATRKEDAHVHVTAARKKVIKDETATDMYEVLQVSKLALVVRLIGGCTLP